jgi:hypothetical protein
MKHCNAVLSKYSHFILRAGRVYSPGLWVEREERWGEVWQEVAE